MVAVRFFVPLLACVALSLIVAFTISDPIAPLLLINLPGAFFAIAFGLIVPPPWAEAETTAWDVMFVTLLFGGGAIGWGLLGLYWPRLKAFITSDWP